MFKLNDNFLIFKKNLKLKKVLARIKKFIFKNNRPIFLLLIIKINVLVQLLMGI